MKKICENIKNIKKEIGEVVTLVAVSKTFNVETILQAYNCGQRIFGENRVQEMLEKKGFLPNDIQWHQIGTLQTNKVKYIAEFISMIHAVDSQKLLETIDKEAKKYNRVIDVLLQIHIAEEETKHGFSEEELYILLDRIVRREMNNNKGLSAVGVPANHLQNIRICGLMAIATNTDDKEKIRDEFRRIKNIFADLKSKYFSDNIAFKILSMGMSNDYKIAVEKGSTMVRVGSLIFGER